MAERTDTELLEFVLPLADLRFIYVHDIYVTSLVTALNEGRAGRELINRAMDLYAERAQRVAN